jgi:hypothetical protein
MELSQLFDKTGRRIPAGDLGNGIDYSNANFRLKKLPNGTTSEIFETFKNLFSEKKEFISFQKFRQLVERLSSELENSQQLSNLLRGPYFPICFPRMEISRQNYSEAIRKVFLPAAKKAYEEKFSNRKFSECFCQCDEEFESLPESRHLKLLDVVSKGSTVGLLFFPFQGFSIEAGRRQMSFLPDSCLLSGALDILTALAMYPGILGKDFQTPGYLCSANQVISKDSKPGSLYAKAGKDGLGFVFSSNLSDALSIFSSGLLYVGE